MIRRVINGIEVVETIKPVTCGDEGMIYARFFLPCHCVRESVMANESKDLGADPALALRAEPASRLSASRGDQGDAFVSEYTGSTHRLVDTPRGPVFASFPPECEPMEPDAEGWSEWIHPLPGYLMQCCDCSLIHEMEFEIAPRTENAELNPGESDDAVVIFRARRFSEHPLAKMVALDEALGLCRDGDEA